MSSLVSLRGVHAGYGGEDVIAGIDLEIAAGSRIAVIGPNGAGKTTLLRVLLGELEPTAGTIVRQGRLAVVSQNDQTRSDYPVSALDVALMGLLPRLPWWRPPGRAERRLALAALAEVGLEGEARTSFGALSGGQRQRVRIARALAEEADLLLLDEPFSGVDSEQQAVLERLIERLAGEGRAIVLVTHDQRQADACDEVVSLGCAVPEHTH